MNGAAKTERIESIPGLLAFWDFREAAGAERVSLGPNEYRLQEMNGPIARADEGVFGPHAANVRFGQWFRIPRDRCPALDLHGPKAQLTVAAWVKREAVAYDGCEAVAGFWDETRRKRQYCLFLNLKIWNSSQQVCGHVSSVGGPTPGYPYCMDASIGASPVPFGEWRFVAFTYDGEAARSYLDGRLDERERFNPYPYDEGIYDGGIDGSDFTVGAVDRSGEPGNFFAGLLGGLAVFDRALPGDLLRRIAEDTKIR